MRRRIKKEKFKPETKVLRKITKSESTVKPPKPPKPPKRPKIAKPQTKTSKRNRTYRGLRKKPVVIPKAQIIPHERLLEKLLKSQTAPIKTNPIVSLCMSSIRPQLWMRLYESLETNETPYEIVAAGPNNPNFELPPNIIFKRSLKTNPYCVNTAIRHSKGKYIQIIADDIIFTNKALDLMVQEIQRHEKPTLVGAQMIDLVPMQPSLELPIVALHQQFRMWHRRKHDHSPDMYWCWMIERKYWEELGGIDRRFAGVYWDQDLALRWIQMGYNATHAKHAFLLELDPNKSGVHQKRRLSLRSIRDQKIFRTFWWIPHDDNKWLSDAPDWPTHRIIKKKRIIVQHPDYGTFFKDRLFPVKPIDHKNPITDW